MPSRGGRQRPLPIGKADTEGNGHQDHGGAAPQTAPFLRNYGKCQLKSRTRHMPCSLSAGGLRQEPAQGTGLRHSGVLQCIAVRHRRARRLHPAPASTILPPQHPARRTRPPRPQDGLPRLHGLAKAPPAPHLQHRSAPACPLKGPKRVPAPEPSPAGRPRHDRQTAAREKAAPGAAFFIICVRRGPARQGQLRPRQPIYGGRPV